MTSTPSEGPDAPSGASEAYPSPDPGLQLIAEGMTSRQIAEELKIHIKTVESHRMHLMKRLGIHDVAGLVRYAIKHKLVLNE